ncbi:hypothetical protein IEQ34_022456 [Dendrobium chrysotoxum]|uniref:Uncharacterized protein n=1 Tax=Dendrobium chrysotoxum TaxID=161865 RepID=A0AAV7FXX0_DENCH|nr:hypothetical protein IEQ34_022456 [Dendrobium chrysotoxum]
MLQRGLTLNEFTYPYTFASCGALEEREIGKKAHCQALKAGFDLIPLVAILLFNLYAVSSSLVDARIKDILFARKLFDEMPEREMRCLGTRFFQAMVKKALGLFLQMKAFVILPDGFTFISALSTCAHLGDLKTGKWIHLHQIGNWLCFGVIVGTALTEIYAKQKQDIRVVHDSLPVQSSKQLSSQAAA